MPAFVAYRTWSLIAFHGDWPLEQLTALSDDQIRRWAVAWVAEQAADAWLGGDTDRELRAWDELAELLEADEEGEAITGPLWVLCETDDLATAQAIAGNLNRQFPLTKQLQVQMERYGGKKPHFVVCTANDDATMREWRLIIHNLMQPNRWGRWNEDPPRMYQEQALSMLRFLTADNGNATVPKAAAQIDSSEVTWTPEQYARVKKVIDDLGTTKATLVAKKAGIRRQTALAIIRHIKEEMKLGKVPGTTGTKRNRSHAI